jgi:hypothetical protein
MVYHNATSNVEKDDTHSSDFPTWRWAKSLGYACFCASLSPPPTFPK